MIRSALIIGAGVAGPATALAMQKAGIDPIVFEADPGSADGAGVFLTVASNGIDALRVLGADQAVLAAGFPTPGITLRSSTGKALGVSKTGQTLPDGTLSQTIRRSDLYRALYRQAAGRVSGSSTGSGWSLPRTSATRYARCSPTAARRPRTS